MSGSIKFWKTREANGYLSNFYPSKITIDSKTYKTVEHYFQSQKFVGTEYEEMIMSKSSPYTAATMGRNRKYPLRTDWDEVKEDIMFKGLYAKFTQHPELRQLLLSTGENDIVEDSPVDDYWGIGKYGTGKNRLGNTLVTLRTLLSNQT